MCLAFWVYVYLNLCLHKPSNTLGGMCNKLLKVVHLEEGSWVEGETFSLALRNFFGPVGL